MSRPSSKRSVIVLMPSELTEVMLERSRYAIEPLLQRAR